jgi:death-on-curing protein
MGEAYLFHLVGNHAFIDGNKRVALACAIPFFKINRVSYSITKKEAANLTLGAAGGQIDKGAVTASFKSI